MEFIAVVFVITFVITLPILLYRAGIKLRWFVYWSLRGKPHPDHIAKYRLD